MARPRADESNPNLEGWGHLNPEAALESDRAHIPDEPFSGIVRGRDSISDLLARVVPHGKKYGWVAIEILNIPQRDALQKAYNKGYRFVPSARHPDIIIPNIDGRHSDDRIYDGGRVLMEIDENLWNQDQKYFEDQDREIKMQSRHLTDYLGNDSNRFIVKDKDANSQGFSPIRERAR